MFTTVETRYYSEGETDKTYNESPQILKILSLWFAFARKEANVVDISNPDAIANNFC